VIRIGVVTPHAALGPEAESPAMAPGRVGDAAEAVFIGGNGFRAAGAIAPLEKAIGRPILTSNQDFSGTCSNRPGPGLKSSATAGCFGTDWT
jgi:maleate cis-trans isomerase